MTESLSLGDYGAISLYLCSLPFVCFYSVFKCLCNIIKSAPTEEEIASARRVGTITIGSKIIYDGYTPYEESGACNTCQLMSIQDLLSPHGYAHCHSYDQLYMAAQQECKLCALLILAIERRPENQRGSSWVSFRDTKFVGGLRPVLKLVSCNGEKLKSDLVEICLEKLDEIPVRKEILAVIGMYAEEGSLTPISVQILDTDLAPGSRTTICLPGRRLPCEPNTGDALSSLVCWINQIMIEDDFSRDDGVAAEKQILPHRVLDISQQSDSVIKLIESGIESSVHSRYIALSHCWGRQSHFQLTTETLSEMRTGLEVSKLAKNFQDAILITRLLGIRYLWIDALCILQDSLTDWELESANMGHYYKRAWLTISAGMSDGGNKGLLEKRVANGLSHIRLEMRHERGQIAPRVPVYFALDPIKPSNQCPIRSRGWTFQEELLSRRYLSFETTQTYLRCGSILHHECGRQEDLLKIQSPFMEGERLLQYGGWSEIVMRYSSRNLTKTSDKLPALSGLAHEYQARWEDEYCAGLWRRDLWKSLLWRRDEKFTVPEPRRPAEYRAPSWSWASMDGRIEFGDLLTNDNDSQITIDSVEIELSGSDPMGQVSGGRIGLRAVVIKLDRNGNIPSHLELKLRKVYDVPGEVRPDTLMQDQWLLWVSERSGLIVRLSLASNEQNLEFERVGYFSSQYSMPLHRFWSRVKRSEFQVASSLFVYLSYVFLL